MHTVVVAAARGVEALCIEKNKVQRAQSALTGSRRGIEDKAARRRRPRFLHEAQRCLALLLLLLLLLLRGFGDIFERNRGVELQEESDWPVL